MPAALTARFGLGNAGLEEALPLSGRCVHVGRGWSPCWYGGAACCYDVTSCCGSGCRCWGLPGRIELLEVGDGILTKQLYLQHLSQFFPGSQVQQTLMSPILCVDVHALLHARAIRALIWGCCGAGVDVGTEGVLRV